MKLPANVHVRDREAERDMQTDADRDISTGGAEKKGERLALLVWLVRMTSEG